MNNKIIEFLKGNESCDYHINIHGGKKETYDELIEKYPPEYKSHQYLDGCCSHSYGAYYPDGFEVKVFVNYNDRELKERAREIALDRAEDNARDACMQKWRETQELKKD